MAQHDYNLANQSGADFRADLNNALSAIATVNSGATEPSTTFAHQLWVDTASNVLKIRNAANNNWITTGVSITTSNTFTGNITGNADTATTLATARTINGTSFDGSANISFDTDSVSEGSSNLYFTNERVDDQVNTLLQAGTGIQLTYDDTAGTLTIANTNDADITGVVAGNGLTGGGTAGTVTLNVAVDDSSIEIDSDALQVKALGITNAMLAGSIANSKLSNSSVTINSNSLSLGGTLTLDTDDIGEGSTNLYYTDARANSAFDTRLATKDTDDLSEGTSNLYYTQARFDSAFTAKSTSDLSEGTNLYYTDARARASISEDSTQLSYNSTTGVLSFTQGDTDTVSEGSSNLYYTSARANADFDTRLATKSTSDLSEGTNLYYTTARFDSAFTGKDTDDLSEGSTNVYYTDARSRSAISASGDISYNSSTGVISFTQATAPVTSVNTQTGAVVLDTDDVSEGSTNLYYTDTRANSAIDTRVTKAFVDALGIQASSVDANSVALGTDTTGNYVATITGTANKVSVSGSGSESAAITLSLPDDVQIADSLTVAGNLTVNGTLTSLDTTNLDIEDNLFQLNAGLTGSPVNDSGMLINRGNQNNGIFMWDESVDKFTLGLTTADGTSTGNITLSSLGTLVANIEGDVTGSVTGTVSSISNHSTSDLSEGTNLYYTDARVQAVSINNVVEDTTPQLGGNLASNGNDILFGDSDKAIFGAGSDLEIYHDGSNSYVSDQGTGNLRILAQNFTVRNPANNESMIIATPDAGVTLYYDNSSKFATTSTGIDVTGVITTDGLTTSADINFGDNDKAIFGADSDLQIYHDGSNSYIAENGTGDLYLKATHLVLSNSAGANYLVAYSGGSVNLYNNNQAKLSTTSTGIDVTGTATMDGLTVDGTATITYTGTGDGLVLESTEAGASAAPDLVLYRNSSSPADNDQIGNVVFKGEDSAGNGATYGRILVRVDDVTDGTEDSTMFFNTMSSGALGDRISIVGSNVGIATSSPTEKLTVNGAILASGALQDDRTSTAAMDFSSGVTRFVSYGASGVGGQFAFRTASGGASSTERMRIDSSGNVGIGTSSPASTISGSAAVLHLYDGTNNNLASLALQAGTVGSKWEIGALGSNALGFFDDGAERMRIDSSGNVAIGSTNPRSHRLYLENAGSSGAGQLMLVDSDNSGLQREIRTDAGVLSFDYWDGSNRSNHLTIAANGNVGIGTTSPSYKADIQNSGDNILQTTGVVSGGVTALNLRQSRGSLASPTNSASNGDGNYIVSQIYRASAYNPNAWIGLVTDSATDGGRIIFGTASGGTVAEKMRIDSSGNLLVGGTSVGANDSCAIDPSGIITIARTSGSGRTMITFKNAGAAVGTISTTTTATTYSTSSDARLKDVTGSARGLEVINKLNPVSYNWKADGKADEGLIAQEVLNVVPNAVSGSEEEMYQMDYSKLVVHLVAGMKEQQTQIEALQSEINLLKGE